MSIIVKELSKIYGSGENRVTALDRASMEICDRDFISIVGPSGSGKSTLLHLISGLDRPTSGTVLYEERTFTAAATAFYLHFGGEISVLSFSSSICFPC